jgi:hypothetical protein
MALVTWPGFGIRSIQWTLDRPAQVNRSAYTGARSVATNPWHGKLSAHVELAPIVREANGLALRAFLASLRGALNTFRIPATEGGQFNLPAATVQATAAKGATSMTLSGAFLWPGQMLTVNDQLLLVVTSADSSGNCAITFESALREQATAATVAEVGDPTCLVALTDSSVSWSVDPGQLYGCTFDVEEVF